MDTESSCRPRLLSGLVVAHAEAKICELFGLSHTDSLHLDERTGFEALPNAAGSEDANALLARGLVPDRRGEAFGRRVYLSECLIVGRGERASIESFTRWRIPIDA
jgi:hypothetical protein